MNRKGQSSIEYLMNYAWAIALIIIVGVAIFGLNIGDIQNSLSAQSSEVSQAAETVAVTGHTCSTDGSINIAVKNNGANKITSLQIGVTGVTGASGVIADCVPDDTELFPGDTTTCSDSSQTWCQNMQAGNPYDLGLNLSYVDDRDDLTYTPIRNITGTVQS